MRPAMLLLISCLLLLPSIHAQDNDARNPITSQNFEDLALIESIGKGWIIDADFSSTNSLIAIGGSTGIWIYDLQTNRYTNHLSAFKSVAYPVTKVLFNPDGTLLAGVYCNLRNQNGLCISSTIQLWNTQNFDETFTIDTPSQVVYDLTFSPDSHTLAYVATDVLSVYDIALQERIAFWELGSETTDVSFSSDGNRIAVSSTNGVFVWSVEEGRQIAHFDVQNGTTSVRLSSDGTLVAAGLSRTVKVWDVDSLTQISTQPFDGSYISDMFFNQEDSGLIYVSRYFPEAQSEIVTWDFNGTTTSHNVTGEVHSLDLLENELAFLQSDESVLRLIDYSSSTVRLELSEFFPQIKSMAFDPRNSLLAVGYGDGIVRLWDIWDYSLHTVIDSDNQSFGNEVAFDMTGTKLAVTEGTNIRIWDITSQQTISTLEGHTSNVYGLGFTQDGQYLISTSVDSTIRVWDTSTWESIATYENSSCGRSISLSHDQARFAVSSWGCEGITIRDSNSFEIIAEHNLSCCVASLGFHPTQDIVVVGKEDGEILILDSGIPSSQFMLPSETYISDIAFTSGGSIFVANDLVVDFEEQISFQLLDGQTMNISAAAFASDDKILALGSRDGTIRLFGIP